MKKSAGKKPGTKAQSAPHRDGTAAPMRSALYAPHLITVGGKTMTVAEWAQAARAANGVPDGRLPASLQNRQPAVLAARLASAQAAAAPTLPAPQPADIEAVFDALVIGGMPRGKTWLMHFLKAWGHRRESLRGSQRSASLSSAEVTQILQRLAAAKRIRDSQGQGYGVDEAAIAARLPALLADEPADKFWKWSIWAAGPGYGEPSHYPSWVRLNSEEEAAAVYRLLMYLPGMTLNEYTRMVNGALAAHHTSSAVMTALTHPFMPALFEGMESALRKEILNIAARERVTAPLEAWISAWLARAPAEVPQNWCFRIAERRMHALDFDGMRSVLAAQKHAPLHDLFEAAALAAAGRWDESAAAFAVAYKAVQQTSGSRRGAAPIGLTWVYPLALLAQQTPAALTAARKFFTAESGSRKPSPYQAFGRWVHAAAVRMGDEKLDVEAFSATRHERDRMFRDAPDDAAHRILLAAWLDTPAGWSAADATALLRALAEERLFWLAALVHQAAQRLGLKVKPLEPDHGVPPFLGAKREVWRDALAAITALGGQEPAVKNAAHAPVTLTWEMALDQAGRVMSVTPYERSSGVRGPGKFREVSLARVKKTQQLDARDAAVARAISNEAYSRALDIDPVAAAQALVNHPAVLIAGYPGQLVEISEALPVLEVRRRAGARARLDAGQIESTNSGTAKTTTAKGAKRGKAAARMAADTAADVATGTDTGVGTSTAAPAPTDSFVFHIDPPLITGDDHGAPYARGRSYEESFERFNSIRIIRDAPDRARLIRVTPAQRRVAELIAKDWAVPVDAKEELDAALRVLSGHFQLHSDAAAGEEVPGDARLRAQLTPQGDGLHLRLVVLPFGAFGPAVPPGVGRERLMTMHEGLSLTTLRALDDERAHWRSVAEALPFLDDGTAPDAGWMLDDPEQALRVVEALPTLAAVAALDWPRGKPLRVVSVDSAALGVSVSSGRDWFALDGEVRVDPARVLNLKHVLELARASRSRFVALGAGEYLALSERLRRQLADLDAAGRIDKDSLKLPLAAAAWLEETLDGATVASDNAWKKRIAALAGAAALEPVVEGLQTELRAYQYEGFTWMARLAHAGLGACLADDMGLGKTIQTLALLLGRAKDGPALVLAPTSVCANWLAEVIKFAPALNARLYAESTTDAGGNGGNSGGGNGSNNNGGNDAHRDSGRDASRAALVKNAGPYDVIIASYALAHGDNSALGTRAWATLVLDEAQALKNAATQRARAVAGIDAGFRLALSGTPVENRLADLWSIMNLINPGLLGTANQFNERFAGPIEKQRDAPTRQRLRRLVSPFLLRRTKAQVLQDLPPRTEIIHRVEPSEQERTLLEALRQSAKEKIKQIDLDADSDGGGGKNAASFQVLAELTRLRRAACDPRLVAPELGIVGAKTQAFETIVRELVDGQHKALVFSQFTGFLKLLAERLDGCNIKYQYLDGSTPAPERAKRVQAFQRGEGEVFLISLKAGGFGLNLTAADYVLIVDPWWNPAAEDQAMGRAHRIGQQRPVTVYRLVTAGSIEERIVELHQDKRSLADGILEGQDDAAPLSAAVLRELLLDKN